MTDKELTDKYYATDLKLYMIKRGSNHSSKTESSDVSAGKAVEYSNRDINKIKNLEAQLEVMKQELIKREYMP